MSLSLVSGALFGGQAQVAQASDASPDPLRIIGGTKAKSCHWPAAPHVQVGSGTCTGSLVHPEIVVTAAHCNANIRAITFTDSTRTSSPKRYSVEYCKSHPSWQSENASLGKHIDFAFCKLAKPVTEVQITPIMMGCEEEYLQKGAEIYAVGFGKTVGNNPKSMGTKYQVKTTFNGFSSQNGGEIKIGSQGKGSCHGDSGGPLYAKLPEDKFGKDAGWRVFGVTSWGDNTCPGPANYGRLSKFVPFIEKTSGLDITPCTDADGTWNPTKDCKGAPLDPFAASGSWQGGCKAGPVGGPIASCGDPFAPADDKAPTVSIESPSEDASFEEGQSIEVEVSAEDDVGVTKVELLVDDKSAGTLDAEPFEWTLEELKVGEHELVAIAKDAAGNEAKSEAVTLLVEKESEATPKESSKASPKESPKDSPQGTSSQESGGSEPGSDAATPEPSPGSGEVSSDQASGASKEPAVTGDGTAKGEASAVQAPEGSGGCEIGQKRSWPALFGVFGLLMAWRRRARA